MRVEDIDGEKLFYEGEKGAERLVRVEFPDGSKEFYENEKGVARRVRTEFPDGRKQFYEGEKGAGRLVRTEFPDGRVEMAAPRDGKSNKLNVDDEGSQQAKKMRIQALAEMHKRLSAT